MQRAVLALIGSHRRRTYAHDLVYGSYQQYMLFGKPWSCATEGSEHAHQDMKNRIPGKVQIGMWEKISSCRIRGHNGPPGECWQN